MGLAVRNHISDGVEKILEVLIMGTSGNFIIAAIIAVALIAIVVFGAYFFVKSLIRYYFKLKNAGMNGE